MSINRANTTDTKMTKAIATLALMLSIAITFLATPLIHQATVDWAVMYLTESYGSWIGGLAWHIWFVLVAGVTFGICNVGSMTAILLGQFFLATSRASRHG